MRELRQLIQTVAPTDARVLVLGESGTGKELVAGALHSLSQRTQASYVRINCAAIPETLLESELFGHEKGAFTGALKQKPGRVEEADGGTIFLDEIADMSRPLQAKLLRFLEDGTFTRVGGTQELRVNVRLIAATNRDIIEAIRQGQFREDLFHRLNVVQFRLPPLRERGDDVLLLADYFLRNFGVSMNKNTRTISRAARQKLLSHHWPGNVRELRNVIERALILETTSEIQPGSLPDFQLEGRLHKTAAPRTGGHRVARREDGQLRAGTHHRHAGAKPLQPDPDRRAVEDQPPCLALSDAALEYRRRDRRGRRHGCLREERRLRHERHSDFCWPTMDTDEVLSSWRIYGSCHPRRAHYLRRDRPGHAAGAALGGLPPEDAGRRRHSHHHSHQHSSAPAEAAEAPDEARRRSPPQKRRKRRRSRRRHRPRNPTLAETGGLPPVRPEGPPEPQP